MKKAVQLLIGCLVSAAMLFMAFRGVDTEALGASLLQAKWWPAVPFVLLFCTHHVFRAMRWRLLLPCLVGPRPTLRQLFDATILGNLATFLLPFRVGEFVRPLLLSRWSSYAFGTSFVSVVIERFFDLSAVLLSFACIAPWLPSLPPFAVGGAKALGVIALAILLFITVGSILPKQMKALVDLVLRPLPGGIASVLGKFAGDLLEGAAVLKGPWQLLGIVILTSAVWATAYLQFYALLFMFPHETSLLISVTLGVFVALAVALPSAPGFVGVFQAGCVAAFALFHYPESSAKAFSLLAHALTYLVYLVIGFALLAIHGLSLSELKVAAEKRDPAVGEGGEVITPS